MIGLEQEYTGTDTRTVVTHDFGLVTRIHVQRGTLSFPLASGEVMAPERFMLWIPPRAVLPMRFTGAHVLSRGFAGEGIAPGSTPGLLPSSGESCAMDLETGPAIFASPHHTALRPDQGVPEYARVARAFLHEHLGAWAPVTRAARHVDIRPETLTRAFQAAYRLTPKSYSNKARLFQSVMLILGGRKISDTAFASGFGDLKRFYAQFSSSIGATPGEYARASESAKTWS